MLLRAAALGLAIGLAGCATDPGARTAQPPRSGSAASAVASWNAEALAETISYVAGAKSTAFLIVQDGTVIAEHRWPLAADAENFRANFTHGLTARGDLLEDVASMQKSFVAILAGVAVDKGLLDVSKPVTSYLGAGWSKANADQEAKITVRHLLEMTSGLTDRFEYETAPGAKFFYNTPVYAALKPVLEKATGQTLDGLTRDWLTSPLGMDDTAWRQRPSALAGNAGNPTGLVTVAPDMVKMGQLLLDRGKAPDGRRVISEAQLDQMLTPTPTNPAYGRLWWLNSGSFAIDAGRGARTDGPMIATAPADLIAAQGAQERKLYIVPSRKLIVVRMGPQTGATNFNAELWARLMKALPAQVSQ